MDSYFKTFPKVEYGGKTSVNLVTRSAMSSNALDRYGVYYPYRVKDHERPDTVAFDYYGDSKYSWLVLMANDMVDPYHDWPMSDADFDSYIVKKYGSREAAMRLITAYASYDSNLTMTPTTRLRLPVEQKVGFDYPVYAFDWERDRNEQRKSIRLLSRQYAQRAYDELRRSHEYDRA